MENGEVERVLNWRGLELTCNTLSCKLDELSEEQLVGVEELYLHSNMLESLPSKLWELKSLKRLYLGYNFISNMPKEVGTLQELTQYYFFFFFFKQCEKVRGR